MADIAAIFHWSLREMEAMSPWELGFWWKKSAARAPQAEGEEDG